ncbi:MAG: hypothetical protein ACFFC3_08080, partial [Candidatus Odinarchaeota archaeon]
SKSAVGESTLKINTIIQQIEETFSTNESISASTEQQTASMEEILATANKLGSLADNLKIILSQRTENVESGKVKPKKKLKLIKNRILN